MLKESESGFASNIYLFMGSSVALGLRLRRPDEAIETVGAASLTGIGGRSSAEGSKVSLHGGSLSAESYKTEVIGDFADRKAAAKLTASEGKNVSAWGTNKLATVGSAEGILCGAECVNFDSSARANGKRLRIGRLEMKMVGQHQRKPNSQMSYTFEKLTFADVSINGKALRVSVRPDLFNDHPTFESFAKDFNRKPAFRKELGGMVARPPRWDSSTLFERRGFSLVTVVNKIEWVDPKGADPDIKIKGHSIIVPGFGSIYLGEMTISPVQRRIHMARIELGCPDGGGALMLSGCPGYHEFP